MTPRLFNKSFVRFAAVGAINTVIGAAIMFALYNLAHLSYWLSSATNYIVGSILSFALNRSFTFSNKEKVTHTAPKFLVNIAVCYLVAYGIAKPVVACVLQGTSSTLNDNVAMAVGVLLFAALNYLGQRYFVFKKSSKSHPK